MTAGQRWVYFFGDDLPPDGPPAGELLGGKGASLAEMTHAGLAVPPGFTITTRCCQRCFELDGRWPPGLAEQVEENLARLEAVTGRQFGRGRSPLFVSVRSGAAVSMPGMMDTILNCGIHPGLAADVGDTPRFWRLFIQFVVQFSASVADIAPQVFQAACGSDERSPSPLEGARGIDPPSRRQAEMYMRVYQETAARPFPTDPRQALRECIDAVFASFHSERAAAYRRRNNIRGLPGTAVNVQAMFPSQVSGILFTQDPNDLSADRMVIEASYGLGEAIVSGDVTPDRFRVSRADPAEYDASAGHKVRAVSALGDEVSWDAAALCLTGDQIAELCRLALRVEGHFGRPQDIEWGWADGRWALLQSRAVRGLEVAEDVEVGRREEIDRLRQLAADGRRVWVWHNLGETLPAPTPLTWDVVRRFMSGDGGFGLMYRDFGYRPSEAVRRDGFLELICGRIYADPARLATLFWDGFPMVYDLDAVVRDRNLLDGAPTVFDAGQADGAFLLRLPGILRDMWRSAGIVKRAARAARQTFEQAVLPPYLAYVREKRAEALAALPTADVIAELHDRCRRVLDDFGKESLKPGFFGGLAFERVQQLLVQLTGKQRGASLAASLTMGLDDDVTVEQDLLLQRVAAGEATMAEFIERFGHRAAGEMELAEPRWREDTAYLERIAQQVRAARDRARHDSPAEKRRQAERQLPDTLAEWGGSCFREQIEADLAEARDLLSYRESGKYYLMMGYELIRLAAVELGRRWDLGRDVFFLHLDELAEFESRPDDLREAIRSRGVRWRSAQRLDMPDVIDSDDLDDLGLPQHFESAAQIKGDPVASGVATGPAAVVFDPRDPGDLGSGYILVCPSTDPGWTPLFMQARGLIVERGGVLSHGAIVARDFGIPAVVAHGATSLIPPGAAVRLDGNQGLITLLDAPAAAAAQAEHSNADRAE